MLHSIALAASSARSMPRMIVAAQRVGLAT